MLVIGCFLPAETQKDILKSYGMRHTKNNDSWGRAYEPYTTREGWPSDNEWLAQHAFHVTKALVLAKNRNHCEPCFMADCVPMEARAAGLADNTPPLIVADRLEELGYPLFAEKIRLHYKPHMMVRS